MNEPNSAQSGVAIPAFYVDAVHAAALPFTVQLVLGNADMEGQIKPCVHLTLSPEFAAHLADVIRESLERKPATAPGGEAPRAATER